MQWLKCLECSPVIEIYRNIKNYHKYCYVYLLDKFISCRFTLHLFLFSYFTICILCHGCFTINSVNGKWFNKRWKTLPDNWYKFSLRGSSSLNQIQTNEDEKIFTFHATIQRNNRTHFTFWMEELKFATYITKNAKWTMNTGTCWKSGFLSVWCLEFGVCTVFIQCIPLHIIQI